MVAKQIKETDGTSHTFPDDVALSKSRGYRERRFHRFLLKGSAYAPEETEPEDRPFQSHIECGEKVSI